jgi:voltage-gated potassium channel
MNDLLSVNFDTRRKKKMDKIISQMKDHTIICGYGRMGKIIAEELIKSDKNFLIIEKDAIKIKQLELLNYKYIEGDATHDEILIKAGIKFAKILVSMVDNDSDALYLALAARSFKANLQIIVRANEEEAKSKLIRAGANKVILPILMSGMKVAQAIINPAVEDFLDLSGVNSSSNQQMYQLVDIHVLMSSNLVDKTLRTCDFQKESLIIVGIKKNDNEFLFAPDYDYKFQAGDTILGLGTEDAYFRVLNNFGLTITDQQKT